MVGSDLTVPSRAESRRRPSARRSSAPRTVRRQSAPSLRHGRCRKRKRKRRHRIRRTPQRIGHLFRLIRRQNGAGRLFAFTFLLAGIASGRIADVCQRQPQEGEAEVSRFLPRELRERRFHVRNRRKRIQRSSGSFQFRSHQIHFI